MKYLLLIILLLLPIHAHAAKAAAVVVPTTTSTNVVQVQVLVSEDSGTISIATTFNVNFATSVNQMNADLKQKVRDELVRMGINITVNDIVLFGGPS